MCVNLRAPVGHKLTAVLTAWSAITPGIVTFFCVYVASVL